MTRPRVVVTERIDPAGLELLRAEADSVELFARAGETLDDHLAEAEGLVVRVAPIDADRLERAPRLRVIGKHGIGVDNVDLVAARARGVVVVFTPGANDEAVAEHTLTLMLMLARRMEKLVGLTRAGRFDEGRRAADGIDLRGKTLGLIGVGRIGGRVAEICRGCFSMTVLAHDPYVSAGRAGELGVELTSVEELLRRADFVSVHTPLTPETRNVVSRERLALMKPTAYLINCARGGLVDEAALGDALAEGRIAGAGIDVFESEPPPADHPLLSLPGAIVTSHVAGSSRESLRAMSLTVAEAPLAVGALTPRMPSSVAAATSTLSTPMPARPTTLRLRPAASSSRSTWVMLRTTRAS
jgi:D-3-phosphoglycerate dehydrogenase